LIDVIILPGFAGAKSPATGQIAIVLDILRATSTMVTALGNHAEGLIPVAEPEAAFALQQKFGAGQCILGGERKGYKIPGFDLGNSPAEYTATAVSGKTVVLCTSNGTKAVLWAKKAQEVLIGSFLNMTAICNYIKSQLNTGTTPIDITIICSGREGTFSLEDFTGAGMIVSLAQTGCELSDTAKAALYAYEKARETGLTTFVGQTGHGSYLKEIGMEPDIALCTEIDKYPIVPRMVDGAIRI
jgi:2-phosphosulfolactate phosphatase